MKLALLQFVKGLGQTGDVVEASDAYARNFLIPKKMAVLATPAVIARVAATKASHVATIAKEMQETLAAKILLAHAQITLSGRGKVGGKLYQALKSTDILQAIQSTYHCHPHGISFSPSTIKTAGTHQVEITWPDTTTTTMEVVVTAVGG